MRGKIAKTLFINIILCAALASCGGGNEVDPPAPTPVKPTPTPTPTPTQDNTAPTITLVGGEYNVIAGLPVTVSGSDLKIGDAQAASWKDDTSQSCKVEITFTPTGGSSKTITSGEKIAEAGKLTVKVTDDAGNSSSKEITLTTIDSVPPEISVEIDEVNVIAGLAVTIDGGQLKIGEEPVASWKDDYSEECEIKLFFATEGVEEQTIESGSILSNAGKLTLSITDSQGNEATSEIALTSVAVTGLEALKDRDFQVDSKTSLLDGITITEGLTLVKTEITSGTTGETATIEDPANFIPELPGTASLTLALSRPDGTLITETIEGLTIRPLVYSTPTFENADYINQQYSWFNVMSPKKQEFIRGHLLTSYVNAEWFRKDNMVYIIMGEVPANIDCENIGKNVGIGTHADNGYKHIHDLTPTASIKACGGWRSDLKDYIEKHPELDYIVSCAYERLGADTQEQLTQNHNYKALKDILTQENITTYIASDNRTSKYYQILNESTREQIGGCYSSASVNSKLNNKHVVVGYNPNRDNIFLENTGSMLPIGFGPGDRVFPFIQLVQLDGEDISFDTTSSYTTGAASSTQGNFLSILKSNYTGITLEDANTILINKYYIEQPYYYKDTDGSIKEGGKWYFIDVEKFLEEEVLRKSEIQRAIDSSASPQNDNQAVALPSGAGLCYSGMGIMFEVEGQSYPMTEANRQTFEEAVRSGKEISWIWSKTLSLKQGGPAPSTFEVRYLDTKARIIPDLCFSVELK